jgi:hypothetical protein
MHVHARHAELQRLPRIELRRDRRGRLPGHHVRGGEHQAPVNQRAAVRPAVDPQAHHARPRRGRQVRIDPGRGVIRRQTGHQRPGLAAGPPGRKGCTGHEHAAASPPGIVGGGRGRARREASRGRDHRSAQCGPRIATGQSCLR